MKPVKKEQKEVKKLTNAEAIVDLKKQVDHHQVMMLKAQGAIEVLEMLEKE